MGSGSFCARTQAGEDHPFLGVWAQAGEDRPFFGGLDPGRNYPDIFSL